MPIPGREMLTFVLRCNEVKPVYIFTFDLYVVTVVLATWIILIFFCLCHATVLVSEGDSSKTVGISDEF